MKYNEQLKTPAWQEKALEIKRRDLFICQHCKETKPILHVHHKAYVFEWKAWEYPNDYLITLCDECHLEAHEWISRIDITIESLLINVDPIELYKALIKLKRDFRILDLDEHEIKERVFKKKMNGK